MLFTINTCEELKNSNFARKTYNDPFDISITKMCEKLEGQYLKTDVGKKPFFCEFHYNYEIYKNTNLLSHIYEKISTTFNKE